MLDPWEVEEGFLSKDDAVKYIGKWALTKGFQAKTRDSKVRHTRLVPVVSLLHANVCTLRVAMVWGLHIRGTTVSRCFLVVTHS